MTYSPQDAARDGRRSVRGYRVRKHQARQAKLNKSHALKAKAVSVLLATGMTVLSTVAYA